ncbi:hypothetical protein FOS14_18310 [Skermania sp. ID1734]|uniref:hypothetical protein n=1 Tax=Skermania sp. ID1734 TaxID=2597516 RepID=UPI00117EDC25|nr:hypothetical protein [Skermania sp. ID1734]TSD95315.1 hypothetical protein FOS14_18310 [Skermania sp. ID1734]
MTTEAVTKAPAGVVKSIEKFLADHGGTAKAVLQPLGRVGVRITLVGADGVLGDRVVATMAQARAAVDEFDAVTITDWVRDVTAVATPRKGHWRKMAGWVANQTKFPKPR